MKTKLIKLMLLLFIVSVAGIGTVIYSPHNQAQAASTFEELSKTYFNALSKSLYLNVKGKDTSHFDIKPNVKKKVSKFTWYIKGGKGNPEAISIDSKTGLVKAKSVGTAYIYCKITLSDKTIIKPEAKVTVLNNITSIEITKNSTDNAITPGVMMDFDTTILDTTAGKDVATSGIIRFELKDDTAGVGEVTNAGILTPSRPGALSIRAICFESTENYEIWLENKADNADYVTAASSWVTVNVQSTEATASTQKELNDLLSSDVITKITISAKGRYIDILMNDYSEKTLVLEAADTTINNHATFKQIIIKSTSDTKWYEYAVDNSFALYDCDMDFNIDKQAQVKYVKFDTMSTNSLTEPSKNNIVLNVNGTMKSLDVMAKSDITLSGTGTTYPVVNVTGSKTNITSAIPIILNSYVDNDASLLVGSEQSFVFIYANINATIENITSDVLHIYNDGDYLDLNSCKSMKKEGKAVSYNTIDTSMIAKQTPRASSYVYSSEIVSGKKLVDSTLYGTFYYNSTLIKGTLSWSEPETVINSAGYYTWIFTPADSVHYNTVTGKIYVSVVVK